MDYDGGCIKDLLKTQTAKKRRYKMTPMKWFYSFLKEYRPRIILGLFMGGIMGRAFKKRFRPVALLGIIAYGIGLMIFYFLTPSSPVFIIYLATGIGGIGQAVVQATFAAFYQSELKPEDIRPAQGMYQFASTGGSSVFTAIVGAAMTMGMGLQQVFLLGTGFIAVGLVVAIFTFRFPKEEIAAEAAAQQK